jgi:membrane-bound metal-dependent hydrolase YbcI (DUF457 family)
MMWRSHAASGAAAGAVLLLVLPIDGPAARLEFVALAAGAALLPDWDHRSSSVTVMWGPLSRLAHLVIHAVFRGHRAGTHDWAIAPPLFAGLVWAASFNRWTSMLALAIVIGATLRAWSFVIPGHAEKSWPVNLAASFTAAYALTANNLPQPWWMPVAAGAGVLLHIAGDAVTRSSVPRPLSWLDGRDPGDAYEPGPLTTGRWHEWGIFGGLLATTAVVLCLAIPELGATVNAALTRVASMAQAGP